jgi:hypothetical protein
LRNYVDLTGSTSPVSVDDLIADSLEKLRGSIFTILADVLIWIHKEIVAHLAGALISSCKSVEKFLVVKL